jgi:CubicO group peptidase (beta-lactamase class C family)
MKHSQIDPSVLFVTLSLIAAPVLAGPAPGDLPRARPEAQGISSAAILEFVDSAEKQIDALHSFMLLRHGQVVAEGWWAPYGAESPHQLFSLSKSFTSTAVGLAVAEGKLKIDDRVLSFFPEDAPADPSENLKAMRVRDLLTMSTGHEKEPSAARDQVSARSFLAQPVPFKPGTHFLYNTAATFLQSAIVQKVTGQTVLEYLKPRLFEPLGIERPRWETNSQGISLGGYGLSVRTEDIARLGQLYLQKGKWGDKQLVPVEWVEMATARQVENGTNPDSDWNQGYGFQFWRSRHGAFRGDGAFGQYCLVMPEADAVLAITAGVKDMQAVLNLVWDKLLPAMGAQPLAEDAEGQKKLEKRLQSLMLRGPEGSATSPMFPRISGRTFVFRANDKNLNAITLSSYGPDMVTVMIRQNGADQRFSTHVGQWRKGRLALDAEPERAMAASGAWISDDTYQARICFYETPFIATLTLKFTDEKLVRDFEQNVGFGPTKQPTMEAYYR